MPVDDMNARRASSLRAEALRLKQLVEDYLDVVRADHRLSGRRDELDLVTLVNDAVGGTAGANGRVNVTGASTVPGSFDGPRIQQLVQNLVSNALKYSETDALVEIDLDADDEWATMTVTDRGIGIPETDLALLFERFHRGQNTDDRRYGGLGLGLYICRQVAEEHGGTITATSRIGEGTTFIVRLARRSPVPPADPATTQSTPPPAPMSAVDPATTEPEAPAAPPSVAELPGEATT
jgi:signal transduction histidine kinase